MVGHSGPWEQTMSNLDDVLDDFGTDDVTAEAEAADVDTEGADETTDDEDGEDGEDADPVDDAADDDFGSEDEDGESSVGDTDEA